MRGFSVLIFDFTRIVYGEHGLQFSDFATLSHCSALDAQCVWIGHDGLPVSSEVMLQEFAQLYHVQQNSLVDRLRNHMSYIEDVYRSAIDRNVMFPYRMGLTKRHFFHDTLRKRSAKEFVLREHSAKGTRKLNENIEIANVEILNWCSANNPMKKSMCSVIKSQETCGSCWAFAATDTIESIIAIQLQKVPDALSPQQLLNCSNGRMVSTFTYCWAENGVPGAKWLMPEMMWGSDNNGCNGGMTHAAFQDAARLQLGLVTQLQLPYTETNIQTQATSVEMTETRYNICAQVTNNSKLTSISGWEQVVGKDCSLIRDPSKLLKDKLQLHPISVAINSGDAFRDYRGGIYECPNGGVIEESSDIDHALLLVGYGSENGVEYWILKNSYGSQWGERGFLKLRLDSMLNCGLNVFPVVPTGARFGGEVVAVSGGGAERYIGLSLKAWLVLAIVLVIVSLSLTIIGVFVRLRAHKSSKLIRY